MKRIRVEGDVFEVSMAEDGSRLTLELEGASAEITAEDGDFTLKGPFVDATRYRSLADAMDAACKRVQRYVIDRAQRQERTARCRKELRNFYETLSEPA